VVGAVKVMGGKTRGLRSFVASPDRRAIGRQSLLRMKRESVAACEKAKEDGFLRG
jgi:hypothetical protein